MNALEEKCLYKANKLITSGFSNLDLFQLSDLLIKLETEKDEKNLLTDKLDWRIVPFNVLPKRLKNKRS